MIDRDVEGTIETFLVLTAVQFDMIPLAFIAVGEAPFEVMQVVAINSTEALTVKRGMRQSKMRKHPPGSPVRVLDISHCDVVRQPNRSNIYAHGLHTAQTRLLDNITYVAAENVEEAFDIVIPHDHPRGTFWYSSKYKGSYALQLGGGMAGMLVIEVHFECHTHTYAGSLLSRQCLLW